jgi:hypothetical protein
MSLTYLKKTPRLTIQKDYEYQDYEDEIELENIYFIKSTFYDSIEVNDDKLADFCSKYLPKASEKEIETLYETKSSSDERIDTMSLLLTKYNIPHKTFYSIGYSQGDKLYCLTTDVDFSQEYFNQLMWDSPFQFTLRDEHGEVTESMTGFYDIEEIKIYLPKEFQDKDLNTYLQNNNN